MDQVISGLWCCELYGNIDIFFIQAVDVAGIILINFANDSMAPFCSDFLDGFTHFTIAY